MCPPFFVKLAKKREKRGAGGKKDLYRPGRFCIIQKVDIIVRGAVPFSLHRGQGTRGGGTGSDSNGIKCRRRRDVVPRPDQIMEEIRLATAMNRARRLPEAGRAPRPARNKPARKKAKRTPLQRLLHMLYVLLVVVSAAVVVVFCLKQFLFREPQVEQQVQIPVDPSPQLTGAPEQSGAGAVLEMERRDKVYTCLIMGVDDGNGNADTIMVATYDVPNQKVGLVSVPRDTLVDVDRTVKKINAAYGAGGVEQVRREVSTLLGIPLDFYVKIELNAFKDLVNAVGGVYFDVPIDMDYDDPLQDLHIHLKAGYQRLNGDQAMQLVRFRKGYANADIGRVDTQQAFLKAMLSQILTGVTLDNVGTITRTIFDRVETDASLTDMLYFGEQALGLDLEQGMSMATLPGDGQVTYRGVDYYYELYEEETLEIINAYLNPYTTEITPEAAHIFHVSG